jgi:hypothetical protein
MVEGSGLEPDKSEAPMLLFIHVAAQSSISAVSCAVAFYAPPPQLYPLVSCQQIPYGITVGIEPTTLSFND